MAGIAVVVPCHNLGRFVADAIASVRRQSRPAAELIVIDDGSDDAYTQWALAAAARDGTTVVRTDNRGVAAARRLGVALTHAPYVVLLDADDMLQPEYLERLGRVLDERSDVDFVTCGIEAFGDASYTWTPPPCTWVQCLSRGGPHVSTMFRRALWDQVGGFDDRLTGYEDLDFWLSAIERGMRGEVLDEPLLRYRVRQSSRYRRAIIREAYVDTMTRIHRAHPPPTPALGRELLAEKERFLEEQRAHQRHLRGRRAALETALAGTDDAIRTTTAALAAHGRDALDWGDLRRTAPASPVWGLDRGRPLDRYYIENFLEQRQADIRGRVLEVKDPYYATRFGGTRITCTDVVDVDAANPRATIVADLTDAGAPIPGGAFDCFILTQTLHIIFDIRAVLATAYRILRPGGVLLCTVPCVSRISYEDGGLDDGDFWRFTEASIRTAMAEAFPVESVEVATFGNVQVCAAFLLGLDPGEVPEGALDYRDPAFPLICCVRAVKPAADGGRAPGVIRRVARELPATTAAAVLLYHRVGTRQPDVHRLCLETDVFRDHMRHLRDTCRPMPIDELIAGARAASLPSRAVAVTFDDGCFEHLSVVSPILAECGIPATFYVNTERLATEHEAWWDTLERILLAGAPLPAAFDLHGDGTRALPVTNDAERLAAHQALLEVLYPVAAAPRAALVARLVEWSGLSLPARPSHRRLTGDEVRQLAGQPGHRVGAHTVHHLCLPRQPREVQLSEMTECRRILEETIQRPVVDLAYPYGEHDGDTVDAARAAGFSFAVTVEPGLVGIATEPLVVPRFEVGPGNAADVQSLLSRAFAPAGR